MMGGRGGGLRWSGEHTFIYRWYRGLTSEGGSTLNGVESTKLGCIGGEGQLWENLVINTVSLNL